MSYAESDLEDEDETEVFKPMSGNSRYHKRRKIVHDDDSDDEFGMDAGLEEAMQDEDGQSDLQSSLRCIEAYCGRMLNLTQKRTTSSYLTTQMMKRQSPRKGSVLLSRLRSKPIHRD